MADIELVISVPEKLVCEGFERPFTEEEKNVLIKAIGNGTPLPKGHGRIVDESKITKSEQIGLIIKNGNVTRCLLTDAPTIIEADKSRK